MTTSCISLKTCLNGILSSATLMALAPGLASAQSAPPEPQAEPFADYSNPLAEPGFFEDLFGDDTDDLPDLFVTEADIRADALLRDGGWSCLTYGLGETNDEVISSFLTASATPDGVLLTEVTPMEFNGQAVNIVIEYDTEMTTDEFDNELYIVSTQSRLLPIENKPDGLNITDPGQVELVFGVFPDEEFGEGYLLHGETVSGGITSGFGCAPD